MTKQRGKSQFVVCVSNRGYSVSLERGKIYRIRPDLKAEAHRLVRVIDESGEDYLYPVKLFLPISLPQPVAKALRHAA
ncbi:MAG TPA: hypothetical protein VJS66_06620 [Burkholderiales bacterium]|nr:hypothetical protein [Burkholderiales bacterium]